MSHDLTKSQGAARAQEMLKHWCHQYARKATDSWKRQVGNRLSDWANEKKLITSCKTHKHWTNLNKNSYGTYSF